MQIIFASLVLQSAALLVPPASCTPPCAARATPAPLGRRALLAAAAAAAAAAAGAATAAPASASYALYQASMDTYSDRKAGKFVPVATDDRQTLLDIQEDIRRKRPASAAKKKKPQYATIVAAIVHLGKTD